MLKMIFLILLMSGVLLSMLFLFWDINLGMFFSMLFFFSVDFLVSIFSKYFTADCCMFFGFFNLILLLDIKLMLFLDYFFLIQVWKNLEFLLFLFSHLISVFCFQKVFFLDSNLLSLVYVLFIFIPSLGDLDLL